MALIAEGQPGAERTRHIDIMHNRLADRVKGKEAVIEHIRTAEAYTRDVWE